VTADTAFAAVIAACAAPRADQDAGTWITPQMHRAYCRLHRLGHAHSIEVWQAGALVGGLYGVAIGQVFFGESMFSTLSDASKTALAGLALQWQRWGCAFIDCQVHTEHLARMGAVNIPRTDFMRLLERYCALPGPEGAWLLDENLLAALAAPSTR
ncbi:MAG: leucyl/phenylalanyl-tRNA--protein transferase, partial [Candidatus Contendobacter sp.]